MSDIPKNTTHPKFGEFMKNVTGGYLPIRDATQSAVAGITESLPYFELAGHRLERQNHGVPNCPDIVLNEKKASPSKPQAWSKEIDGQEHWFYNYPGACAEALFLGREIPTIEQWGQMFKSVEGNDEQKAKTLGIPLVGYRDAIEGEFHDAGGYASLWSSSPGYGENALYAILERGNVWVFKAWDVRERGMSLRFLSDKK